MMDKGSSNVDKSNAINVYQLKPIRREFNYKFSAADVFNEFLYVGDQKGNIYSYPIRANQSQIIAKTTNEQSKNISKYRIQKIQCYPSLSSLFVLSDQKLYQVDSAFRKIDTVASKVHDFAINEWSGRKEGALHSIAIITKKKQGYVMFMNPQTKQFQDSKKFGIAELTTHLGYNGSHIVCSYKKQYQTYNVEKNFALAKGPIQAKFPYFKVTGPNQIVFFMDDVGLFMDATFMPKQKDNITLTFNKPVLDIAITGNYCLILCEGILQIYTIFDPKKCTFVQQINISPTIRVITSTRPFIFGKDELFYLYEIPYQTQIKSLLQKCKVDQAISLLIQNVGPDNEQKIEQVKINSIWPLIKRMQFEKAKQIFRNVNFDIRQILLLYPELSSVQIESLQNIRPERFINTLINDFVSEKATKGKDDESDLRKKSKYFLKDILQFKRQQYLSKANMFKVKISFNTSKSSLVKQKLPSATPEELLQIIDFYIIRWYLDMNMYEALQNFFSNNPTIYCKKIFNEFQALIKNNAKLIDFPTLKPRFFAVFDKYDDAYQSWKYVAENNPNPVIINKACQQCVIILTQLEDKRQIFKKLFWILKKKPQIGMSFFSKVDINFLPPDQIIRSFENQNNKKYLQLYLETIVIQKKTQIQIYHTKLLMLYLQTVFDLNKKQNKQQSKDPQFLAKVQKMRKLLRNPGAKYASQPILKKIQKCQWLLQDEIYLYSRQKRHEQALKKYINKSMNDKAEVYCNKNKDGTLTVYFKLLIAMYKSYQSVKNTTYTLFKKDIISLIKRYASDPQLDPVVVLQLIPDNWLLSQLDGGIHQFLQSAIILTLHQKRSTYTSKHLSQMDLLNAEYNLIQAKKSYLRFTYKKKCCICDTPISDKYFVVYPNANVCHQACVKKQKNTICPVTKQDFQKTFKY